MRRKYGTKSSMERLEKKWDSSGMTDCRSAPEFLLRFEVMHCPVDGDDLLFLAETAMSNPEFCRVMTELVKGASLFDKALTELEFYIDYYMAMTANSAPDPLEYGRVRLFDMFETGMLTHNFTDGSASRDFITACVDKADRLFGGRLEHIKHFRCWLAAR